MIVCINALAKEVLSVHPAMIDLPVLGNGLVNESSAFKTLGAL